ncbi:protein kinase domain-containing protein [Citrus sinensis]|uniref:Protein kinase domain-containing protein n=1 Tax=Citrus sinensis TaxID=2711 RepID=A0ACB8JI18_CITSI|nr:protein kinase domain-containing protein [Citrus sinensis]
MERVHSLSMMSRFLFLHCLILISLLTAAATANTSSITTDQDALLALKAHITHDPTNFLAKNWNTSTPVCNWTGVTCDVHSHRVKVLNISHLNLTGTIPSQLWNLSSLQSLNLGFNRLSGSIPSAIFTLYTLKYVNFRGNQLSGAFPSFIFNKSSLQHLDFSYNALSGEIPANICSNLPFLESISLSQNMFHGRIPSALSNCKYLEILSLSINNLLGAIPKEIGNLTKLKELYLGYSGLQGEIPREFGNLAELELMALQVSNLQGEIPPEIHNLHNLKLLDLSHNKLVGAVPATIFNMSTLTRLGLQSNSLSGSLSSIADVQLPNLEELRLWSNNFSGTIPRFIFNASKLSVLELGRNSFSGFIPNTFGNLRNLRLMTLHYNYLTSSNLELSFLSSFSNCKSLTYIGLSNNPLDGILPRMSMGNLSHSLEYFDMSYCNVSGGFPKEIGNLTNLIGIYLGGNKLNGSIPITLGKLQKLQGLHLEDNKLEGPIPDNICRLTKLYELELSGNKLSGSIPACFSNLASLGTLSLGSNKLTSIPLTIWNLKGMLYLNFSSNFFTGPLPLDIGNLKVLVGIDFSMNNFSDVIPTAIGGLTNLQYLFLGYNRLQGSIPESFGDLISLKSLNLSNNNLSGSIPISLEKLSYLEYLDLSFNKLKGEIPKGGSFGNFSAESFEGNELLCGSPNLQVPPCKTSIHHKSRKNVLLLGIVLPLSTIFIIVVILLIVRYRKRVKQPPNDANMPPIATCRRFSYLELCRATNRFSENNLIGRGGFGSVYKARIGEGMEVAVKVFDLQCGRAFKSFDVECEMMKSIRHRNLIKVISSCSTEEFKALILEYMPHGSLEKSLYSSNYILDIFQRLNIMVDVATTLEYLHFGYSAPVIHCDLKPSNVLLDDNMVAHLSDFGIAKLLIGEDQSITQTQTLATIGYMAPVTVYFRILLPPGLRIYQKIMVNNNTALIHGKRNKSQQSSSSKLMGQCQEHKTRPQSQVEIQERGEIFFFYRPKVGKEEAHSSDDVQRLYLVLRPESSERSVEQKQDPESGKEGAKKEESDSVKHGSGSSEGGHGSMLVNIEKELLLRFIVMGRKSLPDPGKKSRPYWGFVEMVTTKVEDVKVALAGGHRRNSPARAVGEGVYRILRHSPGKKTHTHLIYKLEFPPEDKENETQESLNIEHEGSFLIQIKNPDQHGTSQFRGLQNKRKAVFPAHLQGQFGQKRYCPADPPDFLNYEGCEFLLISASDDIEEELGLELKTDEGEADESCSDLIKTFGETASTSALLRGTWV